MVKIAHISDIHLSYRQYSLDQRKKDFEDALHNNVSSIIDHDVDVCLIAGDTWNIHVPDPGSLLVFKEELARLIDAGIDCYGIYGNHDSSLMSKHVPPIRLFIKDGLNVIDTQHPYFVHEDSNTFIGGVNYINKVNKPILLERLESLSDSSKKYENRVLMLHQGIDPFEPFAPEISIDEVPDNFNYVALGHVHQHEKINHGIGVLAYSGSTELSKKKENDVCGWNLVTIEDDVTSVDHIEVKPVRDFINTTIDLDVQDLQLELHGIINKAEYYEEKPVINVVLESSDRHNKSEDIELVRSYLDNIGLITRITYDYSPPEAKNNNLLSKKSLHLVNNIREHFENKEEAEFAVQFYELLQRDAEAAGKLCDDYYNKMSKEE
jgi:DNA repair exonuclease SbcCD nuclease subunit